MAFLTIPDSIIQVGKALTRELFKTYIKDSLDDLDSRVGLVEGSVNKIVIFDGLVSNASSATSLTGILFHRVQSGFNLTDCKVAIFNKGSLTGTLSVDVQKASSPDFTSSVSVFTTAPSIDFSTASSYDESSNAVFSLTNKVLVEGDYLRIDVTSLPTSGVLSRFQLFLIGEAT